MRVYFPATYDVVDQLLAEGIFSVAGGVGFAATDALCGSFPQESEEQIAEYAFDDAALASIRLLLQGSKRHPHRRVVISADVEDSLLQQRSDVGESVVRVTVEHIPLSSIAAIHVDVGGAEDATRKAMATLAAEETGDEKAEVVLREAMDNYMAWYAPDELALLANDPQAAERAFEEQITQ